MKKLEKLKLHNLEEISAEDQKSLTGGIADFYYCNYDDPSWYLGGSNTGVYNGSGTVSPSNANYGGKGSSDQTNTNIPSQHLYNSTTGYSDPQTLYPTSSQGGTYTGSGSH